MKLLPTLAALCLAGAGLWAYAQPTDDAAAIRQVLEKEAATWRAGDAPGHAACWHLQPYSRILVSTAQGQVIDVPPARMLESSAAMGQGGAAVFSNYKVHIAGSTAWVSHDEESTTKDGQKSYSAEFRMLEKIDGQWKLVGQSIHLASQPLSPTPR